MTQATPQQEITLLRQLRRKLVRVMMAEQYTEVGKKAEKMLKYLDTRADLRRAKVRQKLISDISTIMQTDDCETCDAMAVEIPKLQDQWRNSSIDPSFLTTKELCTRTLQKFVETEPNPPVQALGENLLIELEDVDLRKKEDKQKVIQKVQAIQARDDCNSCENLETEFERLKQRIKP